MALSVCGLAAADTPPSFTRDIKPFLAKYCIECHQGGKAKGGLDLSTYESFKKGGISFDGFVPGKPDESFVVRSVEKRSKPIMPPKNSRQPTDEERKLLRAWIGAGAKDDSGKEVGIQLPALKPKAAVTPAVAAVAYRPDGKLLAAGTYQEVVLVDPAAGAETARLGDQTETVSAVAFSRDSLRLAIASGAPGSAGRLRVYSVAENTPKLERDIVAHGDVIYGLAFSPDGTTLASTGYDRLIKLWDVAAGKELRTLKDHSDTVYGLAFRPDGKLLASAAADRAVKIWDVATGKRLYSLGDATDWLYALAWAPDGTHVAAAGVDRSIRVWAVDAEGGKLVHSVFAHEGPVLRLAYTADGKTLYSLGEDRVVKSWDTARMAEKKTYDRQPEAALALAVRPDQQQLAVGRYDGTLLLLDAETGKPQAQPLPAKPPLPRLNKLTPDAVQRGQRVRITVTGQHLDGVTDVAAALKDAGAVLVAEGRTSTTLALDLTIPATAAAGSVSLTLMSPAGASNALPILVDLFPAVPEQEPNDAPSTAQKVAVPVSIAGRLGRAGDVDFYAFEAAAGQEIGVQVSSHDAAKLEPILTLTDPTGQVVAEAANGLLGYRCAKAGVHALGVRDKDYRGGGLTYRLHVGAIPIVTSIFPLGLQRGTAAAITLNGVHLGAARSVKVQAAAEAAPGTRLPLPVAALGSPAVVVGEFPEALPGGSLAVPGTANGVLEKPGETDTWRFTARKGQRLIMEIHGRRLGSPIDSTIDVLDAQGKPVPRAVLRCLAKTYSTFRDHDSAAPGIRLETWNELAVNDYLYVGHELLRIKALPKNPDDDCQFFAVGGQRVGYLDTTPTHHPNGTPMFKVALHPPGTTFAPNGLPVIAIAYRNDDGGPGFGKDSRLFFDAPADGEYQVRVGDARGQGGPDYAYRLTVRPPRPSFQVRFTPTHPAVWKGGAVPITVTADRSDGFDEAIDIQLAHLPPGFSAPATTIPAGEVSTAFALYAEPGAEVPAGSRPLLLTARATIDGQTVVREAAGGVPAVLEPGDIVTTTDQAAIRVVPGKEARLTVHVERRNGFKGRIPLEVRGLPHGVRVLDIGLNGILITERDASRTIAIYCEPWVQPTEHPIVVLARREGKNTEHAARSVLLQVAK